MSQDLTALRAALFDTLAAVKAGTMELDRARAVNELGKTLIDSAKVEVEYLKAVGGGESAFIDTAIGADNVSQALPAGIVGITRHRLKG
jgi:hypothetical protein